jgi:hypothetical protein
MAENEVAEETFRIAEKNRDDAVRHMLDSRNSDQIRDGWKAIVKSQQRVLEKSAARVVKKVK